MPPNQTQVQLSPEDAKASLGLATRLSEQHLTSQAEQQAMEASQTAETPQTPPVDPEALKKDILGEVEKVIDDKMGELKQMLADALNDDEPEKETKTKEPTD